MDAPLSLQTTVMVTSQQVSCPLGDESAILNMKNSVYYGVNPVGATVWNLLKQAKTVSEIRDAILDEYDVDKVRCEKDLFALLEEMRSEGLIEVRDRMTG
jgi:Coenzyme PQQ synthesis protein D (PqqD)